jgi:hypothetical protein
MLYCKNATQQGITLNPLVLYRGVSVSVMNMAILTGVQFPITGTIAQLMTGGAERPLSKAEKIGAGFGGGAISGFVCAPMELIMIQQQRFGASMASAASRVVSEFGVTTLFRGLATSCGREGLFTAGYLGLGPVFAGILKESYGMADSTANFAGASGAGIIAASLSHPLDTMKTCMQGDIEQKRFKDMGHTYRTLAAEGPATFFKGWSFRTTRMICAIWLIGQCKDRLGPILFPQKFLKERKA